MLTVYQRRPGIDERGGRKQESFPDIVDPDFWRIYHLAKPYSLLLVSGFYNIFNAIKSAAESGIRGDVVECGVWLGGASIFAFHVLEHFGMHDRKVYLYDTFEGFAPGETDARLGKAVTGIVIPNFRQSVVENLKEAGVDIDRCVIVEGPVERTLLEETVPKRICVLRLDTDFYSSTKAELTTLFPRLSDGGTLIIDDYGMFDGARQATDEYLREYPLQLFRVDLSVRSGVKVARARRGIGGLLGSFLRI